MAHGFDQAAVDHLGLRECPACRRWTRQNPCWCGGERQKATPAAIIAPSATIASPKSSRSKFGAKAVYIDGIRFASSKEGRRYEALKLLERVGAIRDLVLQPRFDLYAGNGERVGGYRPDFQYHSLELGRVVVEDVKGGKATRTEAYQLRKKLFIACYGPILIET